MKKHRHLSTIILIMIFLIGFSVMLYPTVSNYINSLSQSKMITGYKNDVSLLNEQEYSQIWKSAKEYNTSLIGNTTRFVPTKEASVKYNGCMNISANGIMGYIEIKEIGVYLPIYHGVSEAVLQVGVGHIEGSSLPVGGIGTHSILSGHRGLPSATLFTDLDKLQIGDVFLLKVLDETLTYEINQIQTVEPDQVESLEIDPQKDLCTLVTCTPYGVNSHRLLITGTRIENAQEIVAPVIRVAAEAIQIEPLYVAPVLAVPLLLVLLVMLLVKYRKSR